MRLPQQKQERDGKQCELQLWGARLAKRFRTERRRKDDPVGSEEGPYVGERSQHFRMSSPVQLEPQCHKPRPQ
jgi:hypothetical protein